MKTRTPVRVVLADNLKRLMDRQELTQKQLEKLSGVAQTSISNMRRPDSPAMKSPKLNQVEKVANAFGLATWQLLLDRQTVGEELAELLMRSAATDEAVEKAGYKKMRSGGMTGSEAEKQKR